MLNEVRRKPEKPRIWCDEHGIFHCEGNGLTGNGFSRRTAYAAWEELSVQFSSTWKARHANDIYFAMAA